MRPQTIAMFIVAAVVVAVAAPMALATSFIMECQHDDYRTSQSDVVFHGTVTEFRNRGLVDGYGEITFTVESVEKGDLLAGDSFVLTQPGRTDGRGMIPAMTLEWAQGESYKIQARMVPEGSDGLEGVEPGDYQLVCGVMGRTQFMEDAPVDGEMCIQVITMARNPETGEFREFPTPCDVPAGWETILPVEPDGGIGDGAGPIDEPGMCAQVITFAVDPETQAVTSFPTPCDVPEGWEVVDEPIAVEPDGGIGDSPIPIEGPGGIGDSPSLWQRFTRWLGGLF